MSFQLSLESWQRLSGDNVVGFAPPKEHIWGYLQQVEACRIPSCHLVVKLIQEDVEAVEQNHGSDVFRVSEAASLPCKQAWHCAPINAPVFVACPQCLAVVCLAHLFKLTLPANSLDIYR